MRYKLRLHLVIFLFLESTVALASTSESIHINKFLIDTYLFLKFPIKKATPFGEMSISEPNLQLIEDDQLASIKVNYSLRINNRQLNGEVSSSFSPMYEPTTQLLRLKNPKLLSFSSSELKVNDKQMAFINSFINSTLDGIPIYKMDEPLPFINKTAKTIKIKNNGITITY